MPLLQTDKPLGEQIELINVDGQQQIFTSANAVVDAVNVTYTPASAGNWPIVAPNDAAEALDGLALVSAGGVTNAGVLAAAAQNTFNAPALVSCFKSGNFILMADMSSSTSVVANVTYELLVDGVVVATTVAGTGGAGPAGPGSVTAFVSLNRATTHQFTMRATASVGTVTTPAQRAHITWVELGG